MRVKYIELAGVKYPMCFSMAAIERIEDAFGSLEGMEQALTVGEDKKMGKTIQAFDTVLGILLDAGRTYAAANGEEVPPPLSYRPSELLDLSAPETRGVISGVISSGTEREAEAVLKNGAAAAEAAVTALPGSATPVSGQA